jgi:SAM-dependent methyltransferase
MTTTILQENRLVWQKKSVLRAIYHDYYKRLLTQVKQGKTLEIGGGIGNLKSYLPDVISTDIIKVAWLDLSCDAQALPFANESFDTLIAMDVLHHIQNPICFFTEVQRVLKKEGRLVLLEPAITKFSWFFYHFFHEEPVILNSDPLLKVPLDPNKDPFDANQAIPELIFGKFFKNFTQLFPALHLLKKEYLSLWCYPLSGGFKKWCLIPNFLINFLLKIERYLEQYLGKHIGFRLLLVVEKKEIIKFP